MMNRCASGLEPMADGTWTRFTIRTGSPIGGWLFWAICSGHPGRARSISGSMCGIVGKLSASGSADEALLERMCAAIEHRGPDSRGTFLEPGVALGIQRLRVIDLERGDQPIANEDGSVIVI